MSGAPYSVGVDIGGTFTDVVLMNRRGAVATQLKVDTSSSRLADCFIAGLKRATGDLPPDDTVRMLHATTIATNTVLEEKGARTALVVTEGFRDILEIARQRRPSLYDLKAEKARPLVPRRLCFEIRERIGSDGGIIIELTEAELARVAEAIKQSVAESVVVALLFSYLNPDHELRVSEFLQHALPDCTIVASSEVIPEFREFERTSTAVLVGYLKPIFRRYTTELSEALQALGQGIDKLLIMNSAGGLMSPEAARERPHTIVESGPAAGVIAARTLAREMREPNVLSFDMGGTTAKASLIENGEYRTTTDYEIGAGTHQAMAMRFTGYPVKAPMIDLTECSAGGGSIAAVDALGVLKVGPHSAGADPGPVCYGRGGTEPTVTDANLVLGRINPGYFVGGEAHLDHDAAWHAIDAKIARPLKLPVVKAAAGIVAVANAHMSRILRVISVARGLNPADFSMVAFGGAGPLHAADLAADLGIPKIIVPELPGLFSALGLLWADLRADFSVTARLAMGPETGERLQAYLDRMDDEANAWLERENVPTSRRKVVRSADMRYPLQNYEVNVVLPPGRVDAAWLVDAANAFHAAHEKLYSYCDRAEKVQIVNLRTAAIGRSKRKPPAAIESGTSDAGHAQKAEREVYFQDHDDYVACPIYERAQLLAGNCVTGPAVIEQADSTIIVPPGFKAITDPHGRMVMTASERGAARSRRKAPVTAGERTPVA